MATPITFDSTLEEWYNMRMKQSQFDQYMTTGIEAHARGEHREALVARQKAFWSTDNEIESARALRDGAASHGYLGELDEALEGAVASVAILEQTPNQRELGSSYDRMGRVLVLINMKDEQSGIHILDRGRSAFDNAKAVLETNDQYYANMIGRSAVSSALYGSRKSAVKDSLMAIKSALGSETRKKHLGVAVASLGVSLLIQSPHIEARVRSRLFDVAERIMR